VDQETVDRTGHLPTGKGLLGALIDDPHPIRLRWIADDPRSVGFPDGHPPMSSFWECPFESATRCSAICTSPNRQRASSPLTMRRW
jgi:hypothetical protein